MGSWKDMGPKERKAEMSRRREVAANKKLQHTPKSIGDIDPSVVLTKIEALHDEIGSAIANQQKRIDHLYDAVHQAEDVMNKLKEARHTLSVSAEGKSEVA